MNDCIFCGIISGEIPSHKIYEDSNVVAFLDINPVKDGHTLIVPKVHAENLLESGPEVSQMLMETVQKISPAIKKIVAAEGFNVVTNIGAAAGQTVHHTHVHIIPRHEGDGLALWPQMKTDHEALGETAKKVSDLL